MRISRGIQPHARKILIYGTQGVGKSRFVATFPRALMIDMERGTLDFECSRTEDPIISYRQYQEAILYLMTENHGFSTVGIDSLTRLNELITASICQDKGVAGLGEYGGGFGKGEKLVLAEWNNVLTGLNALISRGIAVAMTAHAAVNKVTLPDGGAYLEHSPDLPHADNSNVREMVCRWCDEVFMMKQEEFVKKEKTGFGGDRGISVKTETRQLITSNMGGVSAKHRLGNMPPVIDATFSTYLAYVLAVKPTAAPTAAAIVPPQQIQTTETKPLTPEESELINAFDSPTETTA